MSNLRALMVADAPGLIDTAQAAAELQYRLRHPTYDDKKDWQAPARIHNDDAKHLRLIARALGHEV